MSDSQTNESAPKQTSWKDIVLDLVILIAIMGAIGFALKFAMDSCKVKTPTEALCAVIRKGDVSPHTLEDKVFIKELASGKSAHPGFINLKDDTGRTPLMWASYANSINPEEVAGIDLLRLYYVRALLAEAELDAHAADKDGFTALHWACWSGLDGVALQLIAHGLDINAKESHGYTPLMLAAMRGNAPTVKMLLALGADASATNQNGETALQLASSHHAAYAANESSLYTGLTRFWYSIAFWIDEEEKAEAQKHTKGALFYFPIYKEARSDSFAESAALLATPPARATVEELNAELAAREAELYAAGRKAEDTEQAH